MMVESCQRMCIQCAIGLVLLVGSVLPPAARAGPPYLSDDPAPTDYRHFEIYAFTDGSSSRAGQSGEAGIDFNFGALPDLQLTAVLPVAFDRPRGVRATVDLGNVQLAAKYRFVHEQRTGWDVAVFPRIFLPAGSAAVGATQTSVFLPIWISKTWGEWSTFGGGGCTLPE